MHKKGTPHASLNHCGKNTIAMVHMNDYPAEPCREKITDADRIMPGAGVVDWAVVKGALANVEYDGCLSLELFNKELWQQDPKQVAINGLAAMKRVMA